MIVECIDDNWYIINKGNIKPNYNCPIKGRHYEVTGEVNLSSTIYYYLYEFPSTHCFAKRHFKEVDIDISEVDKIQVLVESF